MNIDEHSDVTDEELIRLLDLIPVTSERSIISRTDFNTYIKDSICDAKPQDILSILLEIRIEYDIDEEYFSSLLDEITKDLIKLKISSVNLLKEKQENLL
jgi:hypothetical protein